MEGLFKRNNYKGICIALLIVSLLFLYYHALSNAKQVIAALSDGVWMDVLTLMLFMVSVFGLIVARIRDGHIREIYSKETEIRILKSDCEKRINEIKKEIDAQGRINKNLVNLLKSRTPFKEVSELKADFETCIYEKDVKYLNYKSNPAHKAASKISFIKQHLYETEKDYRQLLYKYQYLYATFPELKKYVDDDEELIHIASFSSVEDFNTNRDLVRDWLDADEYQNLSVDERNQRALDRYKMRKKSNWEIGIEYELYVGYLLREGKTPFDGRWHVIQFGERHGLNDLGRDIVADKIDLNGKRTVYVIQCKRWSNQRVVHENAICQLFGTTIEYKIKHRNLLLYDFVPVFVTTTELSDTAKEFAKQLGVQVMKIPMGDYPMIKCNINNGEKIYHLPFDQQYHRTDISKEGEFYAITVKEATSKGFRRAMRHFST